VTLAMRCTWWGKDLDSLTLQDLPYQNYVMHRGVLAWIITLKHAIGYTCILFLQSGHEQPVKVRKLRQLAVSNANHTNIDLHALVLAAVTESWFPST
jgi:hypothetical protein